MIFLDTTYLLAVTNPRDSLHQRAKSWVAKLQTNLVTTDFVLWELVNAYSSPPDRPKAHRVVADLRSGPDVTLIPADPLLFEAGLKHHQNRPDKEWSLTDCISFIVMKERGMTRALTFDHHFEQAGFEALLRRDPP